MEEIKLPFSQPWMTIHFSKAPLLDNLGITVKMDKLPSWSEYAVLRNWYSAGNWLQRFWQHTVLRLFIPKRYANKLKKYRELELRIKQEFLNEVMSQ